MNGETNLAALLKTMEPQLNEGDYVFCTMPANYDPDLNQVIGSFKEKEGWTIILLKENAETLGLPYNFVSAWITLTVHSSLQAVGLTAAFSKNLAEAGISCNVLAGYYHDHIFTTKEDAGKAMELLRALAVSS